MCHASALHFRERSVDGGLQAVRVFATGRSKEGLAASASTNVSGEFTDEVAGVQVVGCLLYTSDAADE